jgi:hypothetical protein
MCGVVVVVVAPASPSPIHTLDACALSLPPCLAPYLPLALDLPLWSFVPNNPPHPEFLSCPPLSPTHPVSATVCLSASLPAPPPPPPPPAPCITSSPSLCITNVITTVDRPAVKVVHGHFHHPPDACIRMCICMCMCICI